MKHLLPLFLVLVSPVYGQVTLEDAQAYLPEYQVFGEPASQADVEAISTLMQQYGQAWGSGDASALTAFYTADAEWTNAFGTVKRGHDELRDFLVTMFSRFSSDSTDSELSTSRRVSMRHLGDDVAVIHSALISLRGVDSDESPRSIHVTYVLAKNDGEWKIAHQMIMDKRHY